MQDEDVEELVTKAEEQHLDADVDVPARKTWKVEDASLQQMQQMQQMQRPNR